MMVANSPRINKDAKAQTNSERRKAESMLKDIAFVLKMTAKVKGEILASRN